MKTNAEPVDPDKIEVGQRVKILTLGQNGEVISRPDSKGELQVQVGIMKVGVNISDIMLIDSGRARKSRSRRHWDTADFTRAKRRLSRHRWMFAGKTWMTR